jgi:hypothetical protein
VRLLDGPFRKSQDLDARDLESLSCDRLLHNFRNNAGLAPKAPVYGGWKAEGLCPGHTLGHYLSACSLLRASTGRKGMRARSDYVVNELHARQEASHGALVCGFHDGDTQPRNRLDGRPVVGFPVRAAQVDGRPARRPGTRGIGAYRRLGRRGRAATRRAALSNDARPGARRHERSAGGPAYAHRGDALPAPG